MMISTSTAAQARYSVPHGGESHRRTPAFAPNSDMVPKQVFHWYSGVGRPRHGWGSGGRARARLLSRIRGKQFLITLPKVRWSIHVTTHDVHHESPPTSTKCSQRLSSGCFAHSMGEYAQKPLDNVGKRHASHAEREDVSPKDEPIATNRRTKYGYPRPSKTTPLVAISMNLIARF